MKRGLVLLCILLLWSDVLLAQAVFTNGVDVGGAFVFGNGMITLESTSNTLDDASTRDLAPSVGQLAGVDPDTGSDIVLNGDLLTIRPQVLDLSLEQNRRFVVAAAQILGSSTIQISYNGTNLVFSVPSNSISVAQLDLTSVDARYVEVGDDITAMQLTNALHSVAFDGNASSLGGTPAADFAMIADVAAHTNLSLADGAHGGEFDSLQTVMDRGAIATNAITVGRAGIKNEIRGKTVLGNESVAGVLDIQVETARTSAETSGYQLGFASSVTATNTPGTPDASIKYALYGEANTADGASHSRLTGVQGQANNYGAGNIAIARGALAAIVNAGGGTIGTAQPGYGYVYNASGTITNAYLHSLNAINYGEIRNLWGLYVPDLTGAADTVYPIWVEAGTSRFDVVSAQQLIANYLTTTNSAATNTLTGVTKIQSTDSDFEVSESGFLMADAGTGSNLFWIVNNLDGTATINGFGNTWSNFVMGTGVTGDGSGFTGVDADSLGGAPPADYATDVEVMTATSTVHTAVSTEIDVEIATHEGAADPHPGYVLASGDTMTGVLNLASNRIINVLVPQAESDAATKAYVDGRAFSTNMSYEYAAGTTQYFDRIEASGIVIGSGTAGPSAFAQGGDVSATAIGSHAEGWSTEASHFNAHAEGYGSVASGSNAHAEGNSTEASGGASHAEGYRSKASGDYAHAEGLDTVASGFGSHAAGRNAKATNHFSYVWSGGADISSTASNQFTVHAENGIRLLGGPTEIVAPIAANHAATKAYVDEHVLSTNTSYIFAEGTTQVFDHVCARSVTFGTGAATGLYAVAEGAAYAYGEASHAEGSGVSVGYRSHAEGNGRAFGEYSHAEGSGRAFANMSHAEGHMSMATGFASHVEGFFTVASGMGSHAEGLFTVASGDNSHAAGSNAKATNDNSYVWSDGADISSTASNQFTVHAENGIRLLGGPISGDGSGLVNLPAGQMTGDVQVAQLTNALNAVAFIGENDTLQTVTDRGRSMTNSLLIGTTSDLVIPHDDAQKADLVLHSTSDDTDLVLMASAEQEKSLHFWDSDNNKIWCLSQEKASAGGGLTVWYRGGDVEETWTRFWTFSTNGTLSAQGNSLTGLGSPSTPDDAVNYQSMTSYVSQAVAYIPEMGDLSMGIYTNTP